ncbi:PREDICTED: olfactory receptor 1L6-like isoform X2 [Gekko japonicus]|uniref:Olfactory receptor n=1 Tax=Gekko japonicus TaxID=146911 RepID=A0ABM1KZ40_GEKJA|nr:PREDICTED: olfactory receptor 1L6-like isoform X2 [Gekko japonicus]
MGRNNQTTKFILLGVSDKPELRTPLFVLFMAMYMLTVTGNLLTVAAIQTDDRLIHTPMYFFLSCLSSVDVGFTSVIVPTMLLSLGSRHGQGGTISYTGCLTQMYFFLALGNTDSYLLAAMAIDRYVAICNPLHYATVMSHRLCLLLLAGSCLVSHLHSLLQTMLVSYLTFCASNRIPHFFCDIQPLLKLSCTDTSINELVGMTETLAVIMTPCLTIMVSYIRILMTVLRVPSVSGKLKAFSTCGSHLTVVTLFYGSIIWVYFRPLSSYTAVKDRVAAVMYTVITPMLNPFIYSLRNRDMHSALKKVVGRKRN